MYVAELDRPWLDTPFLFQGFRITNDQELKQLGEVCEFVYVDVEKSAVEVPQKQSSAHLKKAKKEVTAAETTNPKIIKFIKQSQPYESSFEEEYPRAKEVYHFAQENIANLFADVRIGRSFDGPEAKYTVTSLVESVVRHPDALMLLSHLHNTDDHAMAHAVNVCTLSITFGRYIGLGKRHLTELGLGALLHDIGETKIPKELLYKTENISAAEQNLLENHAAIGATILKKSKTLPECVTAIARDHHERVDGSGYPRRLTGSQLDLYTMMVSIADTYDSISTGLYDRPKLTCTEALKNIYTWRDRLFETNLVEKFIQCLGIYPIGSVIELRSGELGIVISSTPEARLFPKVLLVRDADKKPLNIPKLVNLNLLYQQSHDPDVEIKGVVNPDSYDIDVRHYLLREFVLK